MYDRQSTEENDFSMAVANEVSNKTSPVNNFVANSPQSIEKQQWKGNTEPPQKENNTGLPDHLEAVIQNLSLPSTNDKEAEVFDIDAHLKSMVLSPPVQQKERQVDPTTLLDRIKLNKDREQEADDKEVEVFDIDAHLKSMDVAPPVEEKKVEKDSHYGTFYLNKYKFINRNQELKFDLDFKPTENADATMVGLTQVVKKKKNGKDIIDPIDPNVATKTTAKGSNVDRVSDYPNPLYITGKTAPANKDKLESYSSIPSKGSHAVKTDSDWTNANMKDVPTVSRGKNSMKEFETAAIAIKGTDKGKYYGSVKWGWERDGKGELKLIPFDIVSMGVPSKNFMEAAQKWNDGKARGTLVVKKDGARVSDSGLFELFQLQKGDEVIQERTMATSMASYILVEVKKSSHNSLVGERGLILVKDVEDKGDGKDTVDLPIEKVFIPTEDNISLYKDKEKVTEDKKLKDGTRMKKLSEDRDMVEVEIVDGDDTSKTGWVLKSKLKNE